MQILKSDWPLKWASFIPDIVAASKTSETLCENTMRILRLLSEEVFDFARIDLTQAKTKVVWGSVGGHTMRILRLLSEEVFDFARIDVTQAKTKVVWGSVGLGGTCV